MVKSVLGVNHQGLRDWLIQRVSAVILTVYTLGIVIFLACHTQLDYSTWHSLFAQWWMKIATLFVLLALVYHAWVGMWTIVTDYVKPFVLRLLINVIILSALITFFFAGLLIFWGV